MILVAAVSIVCSKYIVVSLVGVYDLQIIHLPLHLQGGRMRDKVLRHQVHDFTFNQWVFMQQNMQS